LSDTPSYSGLTLRQCRRALTGVFKAAGLDTASLDARLLLEFVTQRPHADLIAQGEILLNATMAAQLEALQARRLSGEPIDNILGYKEFYGRRFMISKDVLSPRPETEGIVTKALEYMQALDAPHILDLGTGSGAILITLMCECDNATGIGGDISPAALEIARNNARTHGIIGCTIWQETSWFENISGRYNVILSNPPYISDNAMKGLSREVLNYDPDIALRGGDDGLSAYREIISQAASYMISGGILIFEVGYDQGLEVAHLMRAAGFSDVEIRADLSGHDRIVSAIYPIIL